MWGKIEQRLMHLLWQLWKHHHGHGPWSLFLTVLMLIGLCLHARETIPIVSTWLCCHVNVFVRFTCSNYADQMVWSDFEDTMIKTGVSMSVTISFPISFLKCIYCAGFSQEFRELCKKRRVVVRSNMKFAFKSARTSGSRWFVWGKPGERGWLVA